MHLLSFVSSLLNPTRRTSIQSRRQRRRPNFVRQVTLLWGVAAVVCLRHAVAYFVNVNA
jgi:hypothetical protein